MQVQLSDTVPKLSRPANTAISSACTQPSPLLTATQARPAQTTWTRKPRVGSPAMGFNHVFTRQMLSDSLNLGQYVFLKSDINEDTWLWLSSGTSLDNRWSVHSGSRRNKAYSAGLGRRRTSRDSEDTEETWNLAGRHEQLRHGVVVHQQTLSLRDVLHHLVAKLVPRI